METIGERIKRYREQEGMTQEALAHGAGIDTSHFGKIERGEIMPMINTIAKIAQVLKVAVSDLVGSYDAPDDGEEADELAPDGLRKMRLKAALTLVGEIKRQVESLERDLEILQ